MLRHDLAKLRRQMIADTEKFLGRGLGRTADRFQPVLRSSPKGFKTMNPARSAAATKHTTTDGPARPSRNHVFKNNFRRP